jgi:hypothetical protein
VALGYWKKGVSLYTNGERHIAEFKAKHPSIKTGKASINFRAVDKIPIVDLRKVIQHAMERSKRP